MYKSYEKFLKDENNGAIDINIYSAFEIVYEYKQAKKLNKKLTVDIETDSEHKITAIRYKRD